MSEVKFLDFGKTNKSEGIISDDAVIDQERKLGDQRWLDTIVVLTVNYADLWLLIVLDGHQQEHMRNQSLWVPGGVWSQGWNLKKLTEGHHQEWSLRLNLTQHGKTYQVFGFRGEYGRKAET